MGRSRLHWVCVLALGVVALVGCQDVVESKTYSFSVTESRPDLTVRASPDVKICDADRDNCVTTNLAGAAELTVPFNQEVTLTFEKEGFGSLVFGDVSDETFGAAGSGEGGVGIRLNSTDQLAAIAQQLGTVGQLDSASRDCRISPV
jgi:hypothetical protein